MKRILVAAALVVSLCLSKPQLKFNGNGKFKMVQFTDIHFGEDEPDDLDNMRLISDIIEQEKPDLAIITGDVVSGYAWDQKTRPWTAI